LKENCRKTKGAEKKSAKKDGEWMWGGVASSGKRGKWGEFGGTGK